MNSFAVLDTGKLTSANRQSTQTSARLVCNTENFQNLGKKVIYRFSNLTLYVVVIKLKSKVNYNLVRGNVENMMKFKSCETTEYRLENPPKFRKALNQGDLNDRMSTDKVLNIAKQFHIENLTSIQGVRRKENGYGRQ